jgi:mRNA-degrading endonuclease RelE of RelBE toxin-antitoxin system
MKYSCIIELPEFASDLKKLKKKYRTIEEDLKTFIEHAISFDRGLVRIAGLGIQEPHIFKGKHFTSKSIKGGGRKTGIRVVLAYFPKDKRIEFVEIYHKSKQSNHNKKRILSRYG